MIFSELDFINELLGEAWPTNWCVVGGLAMAIHGVRGNEGHDWDILVKPGLFGLLEGLGWKAEGESDALGADVLRSIVLPYSGLKVEALLSERSDQPELKGYMKRAETMRPRWRVITLPDLLEWKERVAKTGSKNRNKHAYDVKLIRRFLDGKK